MRKSIQAICAIILLMSLTLTLVFIPRKQPAVQKAVSSITATNTAVLHFEGLSLQVSFK